MPGPSGPQGLNTAAGKPALTCSPRPGALGCGAAQMDPPAVAHVTPDSGCHTEPSACPERGGSHTAQTSAPEQPVPGGKGGAAPRPPPLLTRVIPVLRLYAVGSSWPSACAPITQGSGSGGQGSGSHLCAWPWARPCKVRTRAPSWWPETGNAAPTLGAEAPHTPAPRPASNQEHLVPATRSRPAVQVLGGCVQSEPLLFRSPSLPHGGGNAPNSPSSFQRIAADEQC